MRASPFLALVVVPFLASCSGLTGERVVGSGVEKREARTVAAFDVVELTGTAAVVVQVRPGPITVEVKGDDNLVPLVQTKVEDARLVVGWEARSVDARIPLVVTIAVPALSGARVSGVGALVVTGAAGGAFDARMSGAGTLRLEGAVDELRVGLSGAGSIDAERLVAKRVVADVSGVGSVTVTPVDALKATVSGAGSVRYVGAPPSIEKSVSGIGTVGPK